MKKNRPPSLALVLVVMISAMAGLRLFSSRVLEVSKTPGATRGDILLSEDSLPVEDFGWELKSFSSSADSEIEEGVFWFEHSWLVAKDGIKCSVSLDQADWTSWHDLSICYTGAGWEVANYEALEIPEKEGFWHAVTLDLKKSGGRKGLVIFCNFGSDGTPMDSAMVRSDDAGSGTGLLDVLSGRLNGNTANPLNKKWGHERVLQTQVVLFYQGILTSEQREQLLDLHLESRNVFRDLWLQHWTKYKSRQQSG